jgi:hypothetical protein
LLRHFDQGRHIVTPRGEHHANYEEFAMQVGRGLNERPQPVQLLFGEVELIRHEQGPGIGQSQPGAFEQHLGRKRLEPAEPGVDFAAHRQLIRIPFDDIRSAVPIPGGKGVCDPFTREVVARVPVARPSMKLRQLRRHHTREAML